MRDKVKLFNLLEEALVDNLGKYLQCSRPCRENKPYGWFKPRRKFWFYQRDRQPETSYYFVRLKGNYIRGYKINWMVGERSINTFMECGIPSVIGGEPAKPRRVEKLISKQLFRDYKLFIEEFKAGSESLQWDWRDGET